MEAVQIKQLPTLQRPILIAAFAGWNDAGDAATNTIRHLASRWKAKEFATIECEDFFDFTVTRPIVRHTDGLRREIDWPVNRLTAATTPNAPRDIVFLHGVEPQLRWKTFCNAVIDVARQADASMILTLGGLLADVPHTRDARLSATSTSREVLQRLNVSPSDYEGPTGIVGVLDDAFARSGIPATSLWTTVPHYVAQTPSPKATLSLVEKVGAFLEVDIDTTDLRIATDAYEQQVNELVESDDDVVAYVRQLEASDDENQNAGVSGAVIAAEVQEFLRKQED